MAATEIADAYIALYAKMPGVKNDITKALGGPDVQSAVEKSGESMGSRLLDGMNRIGKVGAIAVGGAIAAGLGTALVKGFQRLDALDQAQAKLTGLGHSAATVETIMDNALASVKGTAFGMGDAAQVAANAVAAGIKPGADLERTLKAVADASTIAGTDMASMGAIFNKVAASNKVQMDVINQLHDAGVPALALLAEQMGVTAEEASKLASQGKIDFETFQAAMEAGMGGAALESGNTFSGAMDNVMASLGRVGANLLSGIFPDMKNGLSGLIDAMEPLEKVAKDVGAAIKDAFEWIKDNWTFIQPFAIGLGIAVGAIIAITAATWAWNAALAVNPITWIILGIGLLIGAIILLVQNWENIVAWVDENLPWIGDMWDAIVTGISTVVTWLWESVIKPVIDFIAAAWDWLYTNVIEPIVLGIMIYIGLWAAIFEWLWNTILAPIFEAIGAVFEWIWANVIQPIIDYIVFAVQVWGQIFEWLYANVVKPVFDAVAAAFQWIWDSIIKPVSDFISNAIEVVGKTIRDVFGGISDFIGTAFQNVLSVVRGPINALIDLINGVIGGLNSVRVTIPDWVPEVGGQTFGLNIPKIPRLAEGAFITARPGGVFANIGEGRYDEIVQPTDGPKFDQFADKLAARVGASGPVRLAREDLDYLAGVLTDAVESRTRLLLQAGVV